MSEMKENALIRTMQVAFSFSCNLPLVWHLVKRELIVQYKRSALGMLWAFLLPLGQMAVLTLVFQKIIPLKVDAYPLFLFSALLPWTWFSSCIASAGDLFIKNRDLVRKPNFEPSILVLVNLLSHLLLFVIAIPLLFILMIFFQKPFTFALIMLPLLIIIQGLLIIGLGLIIATLNTFYSDVQQIVGVAVMMLFFLTPIFYGLHDIGEDFRFLYSLNPMATLIQNYRLIFLYGIFPTFGSMLFALISSLVSCMLGYMVYIRQMHNLVDTV